MLKFTRYLAFFLLLLQANRGAQAVGSAGITNQVVGARAFGMANAVTAQADDPSAVFFNPAGLTQIKNPSLSFGFSPILVESEYESASGQKDKSEDFFPVVPNFYSVWPLWEGWAFGFGINAPYGLESHWTDTSPLRFTTTDAALLHVQMNPVLSYRPHERISFGAGLVYSVSRMELSARTNVAALNGTLDMAPSASPEGARRFTGDGDQWGYNFGVLFIPHEAHRFGLSYRSELATRIKGDFEFFGMTGTAASVFGGDHYTTRAETKIKVPQTVTIGYAFKPGRWTFEADGEWADYSTVDETRFSFFETDPTRSAILNTGNPADRDWHNSWNLGLGANYRFSDQWEGRGGFLHYPRVIPEDNWDPIIGESSKDGFMIGGSWHRENLSVDGFYSVVLFDKRGITNSVGASSGSTVNGTYRTEVHLFGFNFTLRFKKMTQS